MKLFLLLSVLLCPFLNSLFVGGKPVEAQKTLADSVFQGDSGYITKRQGIDLINIYLIQDSIWLKSDEEPDIILEISGKDTFGLMLWQKGNDEDTVGKYYKLLKTGNYIVCFNNLGAGWETHTLIEFGNSDDGNAVINAKTYPEGQYSCCWESSWDGFGRVGSFIFLKTCGTGSCYCAGFLHLFDRINPQATREGILISEFSCQLSRRKNYSLYRSTYATVKEITDSTLQLEYIAETIKGRGEGDDDVNRVIKSETFTIEHTYKNGQWLPNDSTLLKYLDF